MPITKMSPARRGFSRLRCTGILRVIWAVTLGAGLLILAQVFLRDHHTVFGSEETFIVIHAIITTIITFAIVQAVLRNPKWHNSWKILIIGSVGVAGALMILLFILGGMLLESTPQLALASIRTGFVCFGIWLLGTFLFLVIRIKVAQDAFRMRVNRS